MSAPHILRHLHLPSITPFATASAIQDTIVSQFLTYKAVSSSPNPPSPLPPRPRPTLLTFSPTPVFTTGRREVGSLSPSQVASLKAPLYPEPYLNNTGSDVSHEPEVADVKQTLRGGQITFHGPGQIVIYAIIDLRSVTSARFPKGISPRCYVHLLEETTIRTLSKWGISGLRTENPGVWVNEETKIAALGVHLRRNVTSFGVGLNVSTDLRWFDRINACGLDGKAMTSILKEREIAQRTQKRELLSQGLQLAEVASNWAAGFVEELYGDDGTVERARLEEVLADVKVGLGNSVST